MRTTAHGIIDSMAVFAAVDVPAWLTAGAACQRFGDGWRVCSECTFKKTVRLMELSRLGNPRVVGDGRQRAQRGWARRRVVAVRGWAGVGVRGGVGGECFPGECCGGVCGLEC